MGLLSKLGFGNKKPQEPQASQQPVPEVPQPLFQERPLSYKQMTEEQKALSRKELKRNDTLNFSTEYKRVNLLQNRLINEYGMDAIRLIFEYRNSAGYVALGEFPEDCPWQSLNSLNIPDFIERNFTPVKKKLPKLMAALKERCSFIYAERKAGDWDLHYFLEMKLHDGTPHYTVYTGGIPNPKAVPNETLEAYYWNVPADLAEFYSVHDGFGDVYDAGYIMRSTEIRVMAEMMGEIADDDLHPQGYTFEDLLEFFPDGASNAQCFYRDEQKETNNTTVDWDHEVWEISEEISFYEFIDEKMSQLDEE